MSQHAEVVAEALEEHLVDCAAKVVARNRGAELALTIEKVVSTLERLW